VADEVVPGVWWLHKTRGSNVYLVEASDGRLLLIDTGFASSAAGIIAELDEIAPDRTVDQILLTHSHFDHSGAAMELRERLGAAVVAGAGDCTSDGRGGYVLHEALGRSHRRRRLLGRLAGRAAATPVVVVDRPLSGQVEVAPGIVAVPVPGHTPGSYCFIDRDRGITFVGDLVISHHDGLARPLAVTNADDAEYLRSLTEFAERAPAAGCAGHGHPVLDDFGAQLRELATLPRRSMFTPRAIWERMRRLRRFSIDISRVRRPGE
jgi:glyoxylase-like metal-dependent hydrolase (beta-lactamase superfamily II)